MKKWIKRILLATAVVLVGIVVGGVILNRMANSAPDWYSEEPQDRAKRDLAANRAADKIVQVKDWVARTKLQPVVASRPPVDTDPPEPPSATTVISLTEEELNALFTTIDESEHLDLKYGSYVNQPFIRLRDERLILAAKIKETDKVMSLYLEPKLDENGQFLLSIDTLKAGRVPLPHVLWSRYTDTLWDMMQGKLEQVRTKAKITDDGRGNEEALVASRLRMLLHSLRGEPSDPVLFLPHENSNLKVGYPVKIIKISIADQTLSLTICPLTPEERKQLLARIRVPLGEEPPPPIVAETATKTGT